MKPIFILLTLALVAGTFASPSWYNNQYFRFTSPTGATTWDTGSTQEITFTSNKLSFNVRVDLYQLKGGHYHFIVVIKESVSIGTGVATFNVPSTLAGINYFVRVTGEHLQVDTAPITIKKVGGSYNYLAGDEDEHDDHYEPTPTPTEYDHDDHYEPTPTDYDQDDHHDDHYEPTPTEHDHDDHDHDDHYKPTPTEYDHDNDHDDDYEPTPTEHDHDDHYEPKPTEHDHDDHYEPKPKPTEHDHDDHYKPTPTPTEYDHDDDYEPTPTEYDHDDHYEPTPTDEHDHKYEPTLDDFNYVPTTTGG